MTKRKKPTEEAIMNNDTWTAKRIAGIARSSKSKARSANRNAIIEMFEVFPDNWFDSFELARFLDILVTNNMLVDLVNNGIIIAGPHVPGSPIRRRFKFNSNQGG